MFNRKKVKEQIAKLSRKKTHYDVSPGDAVELRLYGTYENGMVKTESGSYFITSLFAADPDVNMSKLEKQVGRHA